MMPKRVSPATLTAIEKSVIKALLADGLRAQDVHSLVNTGRKATVNAGRISGIRHDPTVKPATPDQVAAYRWKKLQFDHVTGLCPIDDERLVRAREAMILAVQLFNTPGIAFKAGVFAMLTNVAWTYLLHEHFERRGVRIVKNDGHSLFLSEMIARHDCPLSKGCRNNLIDMKRIRDVVEHRTIGPFDTKWLPLFQANCLNFEKALTDLFGARLTLGTDLGFALQFAKMSLDHIATLQTYDLPEHIAALDASLGAGLDAADTDDLEYQFKVVYTLTSSSKAKAHFQFIQPNSAEHQEIQNVLIKFKPADDIWPLKPSDVIQRVAQASGRRFTSDKHQRAWKKHGARPRNGAADPAATDHRFSIYHPPYKAYTYSEAWVNFLVAEIADDDRWSALQNYRE